MRLIERLQSLLVAGAALVGLGVGVRSDLGAVGEHLVLQLALLPVYVTLLGGRAAGVPVGTLAWSVVTVLGVPAAAALSG